MRNKEKIEDFIRSVFEVYGLDYMQYFSTYTADDEKVQLPMIIDDALDMTMVHRAAEILGENAEDLLAMDSKRVAKWQNRFPYIDYKRSFEYACNRSYYGKDYDALRLMEAIWGVEHPDKPMRYNYKSVTERLRALLMEYDKVAPGTYHHNAQIKHLHIKTATFCHFPQLKQMISSFFEMVDRAGALFFKALEKDLSTEEVNEYNIIVSVLGIQDRYIPQKGELHYSILRKLAPIYKAEQRKDFFDYVMLDPAKDIAPWRCAEFVGDREMVQTYVNIAPETKKTMREYALLISRFYCSFAWSDATPITYASIEDDEAKEICCTLHYMYLCDAYGGLEPTSVYVPKTVEEIGEDGSYADVLRQLAGPAAKGGVSVPNRSHVKMLDIPRLASRISALGGSYHE